MSDRDTQSVEELKDESKEEKPNIRHSFSMAGALAMVRKRQEEQKQKYLERQEAEEQESKEKARAKRRRRRRNQKIAKAKAKAAAHEQSLVDKGSPESHESDNCQSLCDTAECDPNKNQVEDLEVTSPQPRKRHKADHALTPNFNNDTNVIDPQRNDAKKIPSLRFVPRALLVKKPIK